ncbi:MAG: hypothetical protein HY821_23475 [Acidobacteria bacterium]|nr:hypothetical protein [Acidobacteriota bacterium]
MNRREFLAGAAAGAVAPPPPIDIQTRRLTLSTGETAIQQTVTITAPGSARLKVEIPRGLTHDLPKRQLLLPMKNGVLRRTAPTEAVFEFSGKHDAPQAAQLAIPLVTETSPDTGWSLSFTADPFFTTAFGEKHHWVYPAGVPRQPRETRTIYSCLHRGGPQRALDIFYETALAGVPRGPDWLHDIALIDYDFLSKHGRGWFADIDTLEKSIAPADRHKVILGLHGWYDYCGRYTYNAKSKSLDKTWLAFPNAQGPEVQQRAERPDNGDPYYWSPAAIRALKPVEMSIDNLRHRIRYAKQRGFRVALYFADGMNACDGISTHDPAKVLRWGGWSGPETRGRSYALNPLHPEVPEFFRGYLAALLDTYGKEIDALIWDETFMVQPPDHGAGPYQGFAATAMMQLVRELTLAVTSFRKDLAFLASDDVGVVPNYRAPYALMAHGTYQDSHCAPKGWPYGLFPNFRNTLWSCQWAPIKAFDRTLYAVDTFDHPAAISNGYAEDRGVSDMSPEDLRKILDLFQRRKSTRQQLHWIEESAGTLTYKGRPVRAI